MCMQTIKTIHVFYGVDSFGEHINYEATETVKERHNEIKEKAKEDILEPISVGVEFNAHNNVVETAPKYGMSVDVNNNDVEITTPLNTDTYVSVLEQFSKNSQVHQSPMKKWGLKKTYTRGADGKQKTSIRKTQFFLGKRSS